MFLILLIQVTSKVTIANLQILSFTPNFLFNKKNLQKKFTSPVTILPPIRPTYEKNNEGAREIPSNVKL